MNHPLVSLKVQFVLLLISQFQQEVAQAHVDLYSLASLSLALELRQPMQQLQPWLVPFLHHSFDQRLSDLVVAPSSLGNHQCIHQYYLFHRTPKLR